MWSFLSSSLSISLWASFSSLDILIILLGSATENSFSHYIFY
jgi:hypothetical protein